MEDEMLADPSPAGEAAEAEKLFSQAQVERMLEERLGALGEQAARYKGALEQALAAEKKALPRHVLALLEKLDPLEQMEYLSANREELAQTFAPGGVPP